MQSKKEKEKQYLSSHSKINKFNNYYKWTLNQFSGHIGKRVWEAGAGIGVLGDFLAGRSELLYLTDYSNTNVDIMKEKYQDSDDVKIDYCDLNNFNVENINNLKIDTIVLLDVLEHIENDQAALDKLYSSLSNEGKLLLRLPALNFLYCDIDKSIFHFRRYYKNEIKRKLEKAGFKIIKLKYMNFPGIFLYFFKGKILRKKQPMSTTLSDSSISFFNKVVPIIEKVENIITPLLGQQLIVVAQKD